MALIVVIDDDVHVREGVARYLRVQGHDVLEAADGRRALEAAAGRRVDLFITDINMPDMDGIEVINELRDRTAGPPVIAISGGGVFPKELLLENAEVLGAVSTIAKPFDLADLGKAVDMALGGKAGGATSGDR